MFVIDVVCSDPGCGEEEFQIWGEDLDEVEATACSCGHSVIALRVATYAPEHPIRLSRNRTSSRSSAENALLPA